VALTNLHEALAFQSRVCRGMGSELSARVLAWCLGEASPDRAVGRLLADREGDAMQAHFPLRLLGAFHYEALAGGAPRLAAAYARAAEAPAGDEELEEALAATVAEREASLRASIGRPIQTNEVQRCSVLVPGFLEVARRTGLPLRVLELGASAGLNLCWDRYAYALGDARWGGAHSPVRITCAWKGAAPVLAPPSVEIRERAACDTAPVDPGDPEGVRRLRSFVWADQRERLARLDAALAVARELGVRVERARARDWLPARLAEARPGVATIVNHSVLWIYLEEAERRALSEALEAAGRRATRAAPLAHVRFEEGSSLYELRVRLWPGGEDRSLALCDGHARTVNWRG
jgi:hypothetical protein